MTNNGGAGHPACASCRHQRKRCPENCVMAPFFPAEEDNSRFAAVQKVFGVSNMIKMISRAASLEDRHKVVESLVWDARNRDEDPVNGSLGHYERVREENRSLLQDNTKLKEKNNVLQNQLLQYSHDNATKSLLEENRKLKEKNCFLENVLRQCSHGSGFDAWSNAHSKSSNIIPIQESKVTPLIPFSHVHNSSLTPFSHAQNFSQTTQQHYPAQARLSELSHTIHSPCDINPGPWQDFDGTSVMLDSKTGYSSTVCHRSIDPASLIGHPPDIDPAALVGHSHSDPVAWQAKTLGDPNEDLMSWNGQMISHHATSDRTGHPFVVLDTRESKIHAKRKTGQE